MKHHVFVWAFALLIPVLFCSTGYGYPGGISGRTLKTSTAGCGGSGCHGTAPNTSVSVVLNGPATLAPGQTAGYTVTVSGSSGTTGGVDIAASQGTLAPVSSYLRLLSGELVHSQRVAIPSTYQLNYTAPTTTGSQTLYATGKSNAFSSWNFATNFQITVATPPPLPPTLVSPPNGSGTGSMVTLVWNRSTFATDYRLHVALDSMFVSLLIDDSTLVDTTRQIGPLASATYFWRVSARNASGSSAFSSTWRFSVTIPPPPAPLLLSPQNGATVTGFPILFRWTVVPGATRYWFQLASDSMFTWLIVNDSTIVDTVRIDSMNPGRYYWRVRASGISGWGAYSVGWWFYFSPVSVRPQERLPDGLFMSEPYHDPYNPSNEIMFSLPEHGFVRIRMYDAIGRVVQTLVDGELPAGSHRTRWESKGTASGIYFLRLEYKNQFYVRKIALVR